MKDKNETITNLAEQLIRQFGVDFFDTYLEDNKKYVVDFWEADRAAIGFRKGDKVAYISMWDFRLNSIENMKYYVEFELIDLVTLDTVQTVKIIEESDIKNLIFEMSSFFDVKV